MKFHLASAWAIISSLSLHALPQESQVVSGQMQAQLQQDTLQLTTSEQAIIHWKAFSIGTHEKVQFIQPSATSAVLNRVKGTDASHLLGQLTANGKVYLINPNGVIFGKDAVIRTADFLASTLDLSDADFLSGVEQLFTGGSKEAIINYGTIEASDGNVILIGRIVDNQGTLRAPQGAVSLAAGQEILLKPEGISILTIRPAQDPNGTLSHQGKIEALVAELQAEGQAYTKGLNIEGSVLALNTVKQNGRIYLKADGIAISPDAKLDAPQGSISIDATAKGIYLEGSLHASEGRVHITNTSSETPFYNLGTLDVSGKQGGSIQIDTTKFINTGNIFAKGSLFDGGSIAIQTCGPTIETSAGLISVSGEQRGGTISIQSNTSLFSSGTYQAQGTQGGIILFLAPTLTLVSANIDASGTTHGGNIFVGGGAHGEQLGAPNAETAHLTGDTHLSASATEIGSGGTIVVWSEKRTVCYGAIDANAGPLGGNGGWIEVSSKNALHCNASLTANAPRGSPGSALLDPKNIVIDAVAGVYPQYEFIDPNSGGGTGFGDRLLPLSTGNVAIVKPFDNIGGMNAGALYLYNGHTAELISVLHGSTAGDRIGFDSATTLIGNGNFVITSPEWTNGGAANAGAVTWASGITGVSGVITSSNSLVSITAGSFVGDTGIFPLSNGNYVIRSQNWSDGINAQVGAISWGNGLTGISGIVSSSNSLVGSTAQDFVGNGATVELPINGNYVVRSIDWENTMTSATNAGAVSWGSGTSPITGVVSAANSLVGTTTDDFVGDIICVLTNGNYVVSSSNWDDGLIVDVGAVTWGDGLTGVIGNISSSNSLVGTVTLSFIGLNGVTPLSNGNYVVASQAWSDGITADLGAVTWGNGSTGITGAVSASNSLVGTTALDHVGNGFVTALTNGNYVATSYVWNDGGGNPRVGAATWADGTTGITGAITSANSLIGTTTDDRVGYNGSTALSNGNYVVRSPRWANGVATLAGAATWGNGSTGITGTVSSSNSLVGSTALDQVGVTVFALSNYNYVVCSPNWNNGGAIANAGSATWGDGTTGITGAVTSLNSLVGTTINDFVSTDGITELTNGNYVVQSSQWNNMAATTAGAATWSNGTSGITGAVTSSNSLVGTTIDDRIGSQIIPLTNDNYVVNSPEWSSSSGSATWGNGASGVVGAVTSLNSLVGTQTTDAVGSKGVTALTDGNYVVCSPNWSDGAVTSVGAATWGDGSTGVVGEISLANSLLGTTMNDFVGDDGALALTNGNYVVQSSQWNTSAGAVTWGNGTTGITGAVTPQNSVVGQAANSGLSIEVFDDTINGTFIAVFSTENISGTVRVGLQSPNQIDFSRAQAQDMTITPSLLTDTLNTGTAVTLQANNDITISSPITSSPGAGALSLSAGKSAIIDANITTGNASLTIIANDLLSSGVVDAYRDPGAAVLNIANGVTIDTGTGSLTLSLLNGAGKTNATSGDFTIGNNTTLQCSGSGAMTLTAQENNIVLGTNALLQTVNGNLMLSAGKDITAANAATLQTTGTAELILIVDALFPTSPAFGNGKATLPMATLTTGGGKLLIYTSQQSLNTLPATINGVPYVPGPEFVDSITEKWGTYYPNSSGIPFTIFYKQSATPPPTPIPVVSPATITAALHSMITAVAEPFQIWRNPWYSDMFFAADPYPPYLTPKALRLKLPSLVEKPKP